MTPEEKQKADAWMFLQGTDVVNNRVVEVMKDAFNRPEVMSWMAREMVSAENHTMRTPLKTYFEQQLERNLRMILAEGVHDRLTDIVRPMIEAEVQLYAEQTSKQLAEIKKLKSKGPIHGKR